MTDFWPGQDPWNSFEQNPAWDGAGEADRAQPGDSGDMDAQPAESAHADAFVQEAIQRVYHP